MSSSATEQLPVPVVMPQMGISVTEGTVLRWLKSVGETIAADEPICEITTDKIDLEIPAPAAGVLESVLVGEGETVEAGTQLAMIGAGSSRTGTRSVPELDRSRFISPVVRRIATRRGVDPAAITGHGVGGRVRKRDLLEHIERLDRGAISEEEDLRTLPDRPMHSDSPYRSDGPDESGAPVENGDGLTGASRRVAIDPMRRAIAAHMLESRRTSAHCTSVIEVDFSAVSAHRAELKEDFAARGAPLSYLPFVARATVETLLEHPVLNASFDAERGELVYHDNINLSIAVSVEGGLLVPVIRKAQRLTLEGLAAAIAEIATRARERKLDPDDLEGGTFTITNPGAFGTVLATPIINQPQVAILDLEAVTRRPVVIEGAGGTESIGIRPMSHLCMSWDHRALDGVDAARFLASVRARLERAEVAP